MKKFGLLLAALIIGFGHSFAQLYKRDLPVVYLPANVSVHFVSPEPIRFVDISVKDISGDLPVANVLRIKLRDSCKLTGDAVVTITGEKFIAQYRIIPCQPERDGTVATEVAIAPPDTKPLDNPEVGLSLPELKSNALRLLAQKAGKPIADAKAFGITGELFHIYTLGEYIFLDIGYRNRTQLQYDIDQVRFTLEDKKVTKASTVQSVNLNPLLVLQNITVFDKRYRNIFVFKKMTYPGNKVLRIELSEKQISGRTLQMDIRYEKLLRADVIP